MGISRCLIRLAEEDPFWPNSKPILLRRGRRGEPRQCLAIVPRQPGRRALFDLLRMPQQHSQVLEGVHAV
jgi:hypothetical protein